MPKCLGYCRTEMPRKKLMKDVQVFCTQNYNIFLREIKEDLYGEICYIHGFESYYENVILYTLIYRFRACQSKYSYFFFFFFVEVDDAKFR